MLIIICSKCRSTDLIFGGFSIKCRSCNSSIDLWQTEIVATSQFSEFVASEGIDRKNINLKAGVNETSDSLSRG